jgi:hypothetical protein
MALVLLSITASMNTFANIKRMVLALGLVTILGGCQSLQTTHIPVTLDNAGFMAAWDVYRHCQLGTDVDAMSADFEQLARVAQPAPRLAADPKAMAAACALSTGQAALRAERLELATEMFRTVLKSQSQPEYAYYVDQARIGLNQVEHAVRFVGEPGNAPALMTVFTPASRTHTGAPAGSED